MRILIYVSIYSLIFDIIRTEETESIQSQNREDKTESEESWDEGQQKNVTEATWNEDPIMQMLAIQVVATNAAIENYEKNIVEPASENCIRKAKESAKNREGQNEHYKEIILKEFFTASNFNIKDFHAAIMEIEDAEKELQKLPKNQLEIYADIAVVELGLQDADLPNTIIKKELDIWIKRNPQIKAKLAEMETEVREAKEVTHTTTVLLQMQINRLYKFFTEMEKKHQTNQACTIGVKQSGSANEGSKESANELGKEKTNEGDKDSANKEGKVSANEGGKDNVYEDGNGSANAESKESANEGAKESKDSANEEGKESANEGGKDSVNEEGKDSANEEGKDNQSGSTYDSLSNPNRSQTHDEL